MAARVKAPPVRKDGLQLDEKRGFQLKFWRLERLAWLIFALLVAAALSGLSGGGGFLSRQKLTAGDTAVDLPRISRWNSDELMILLLPAGRETHTIRLGGEFGKYFLIQRTQPAPLNSRAVSSGVEMEFAGSAGAPTEVLIETRPSRPGLASVALSANDQHSTAGILVLP